MSESKEHYNIVLEAAYRDGICQRPAKQTASSKYFEDYIKPSNDLDFKSVQTKKLTKSTEFVRVEDLVRSKKDIKARVKQYMQVLPDERSLDIVENMDQTEKQLEVIQNIAKKPFLMPGTESVMDMRKKEEQREKKILKMRLS